MNFYPRQQKIKLFSIKFGDWSPFLFGNTKKRPKTLVKGVIMCETCCETLIYVLKKEPFNPYSTSIHTMLELVDITSSKLEHVEHLISILAYQI